MRELLNLVPIAVKLCRSQINLMGQSDKAQTLLFGGL